MWWEAGCVVGGRWYGRVVWWCFGGGVVVVWRKAGDVLGGSWYGMAQVMCWKTRGFETDFVVVIWSCLNGPGCVGVLV